MIALIICLAYVVGIMVAAVVAYPLLLDEEDEFEEKAIASMLSLSMALIWPAILPMWVIVKANEWLDGKR